MENSFGLIGTQEQNTLLGGILVNWIIEQHIERALQFAHLQRWEDFEKELSNTPHSNWIPSEHLPWLILELEMNITIREIQVDVARHMIQPPMSTDKASLKNIVMQMNMGEGKTSVIIPMLALDLCSSSASLVRVVVLKSLLTMNYESLRVKLGGLLNRRVFPFTCRRDMNFNSSQTQLIFRRLQQALINRDIVMTAPEYLLSFDLLAIDKCRRNEFEAARSMLTVQRWSKKFVRDVLDESDEVLHVKYQLIYTVGRQQQIDGGMERWKAIQLILRLVKQCAVNIAQMYSNVVCYNTSERQSSFTEFRLLSHEPFETLCEHIVNHWLSEKNYRQTDQKLISSFILHPNLSVETLINRFPPNNIQLFLIFRGLLSSEVLFVALKKRYRVNFGVNQSRYSSRLMAVPFRAKDVAAENTEFGHPDVAIVLTQLSYYYSGLSDSQMLQCFDRLNQEERDPALVYEEWISQENRHNVSPSIEHWKGVNLKDYQQRTRYLFPTLRYNMLVINYFLNNFVFPREAKQFPHKLVCSAWDLSSSSREKIITGFSGTNDTQLLLPIHIRQYDLPELQKTDAIVLNNLLQSNNEYYQSLPISASSVEILKLIINNKSMINVILDVGALFIDETNLQIATEWLNLSDKTKIDYAVYFQSDSIFVCNRRCQHHAFLTSPASEQLDRCVIYLDEVHTRGTDFKFPHRFRAAVTLGNGLTKDRLVQACMRMRKLGKYHWLTFWSSNEVDQQIRALKQRTLQRSPDRTDNNDRVLVIDILRWVYENTQQATWDGLHYWAAQSLSFQRKMNAFRHIEWANHQQSFTDSLLEEIGKECLESEVLELMQMYGPPKTLQTISEIYFARSQQSGICSSTEIHEAVLKRSKEYGGSKRLLAQLLDEEQQRELEQELEEERQVERPPSVHPCVPILHKEIERLADEHDDMLNLNQLTSVFRPLAYALVGTTFSQICEHNVWRENLWISTEFQRVIETVGESLDPFLRPPRWIVVYRNQHIIFLSALEANSLMGQLQFLSYKHHFQKLSTTTLRSLLPRTKRDQSILMNTPTLTIPPSIVRTCGAATFSIPVEWQVELFIFNGSLYFETANEQKAYCQCLGLCPKPRSIIEERAFERGWIDADGFVEKPEHRRYVEIHRCRFTSNPLRFVKRLIEHRNGSYAPPASHVGSIILNGLKLSL
ncbi:unnamed protein product [Rotaria sp. Silwood1]|nr:unnamed protein product [Rotaria sp. Silwood1]